jgi:hypothetical protein
MDPEALDSVKKCVKFPVNELRLPRMNNNLAPRIPAIREMKTRLYSLSAG